MRISDKDRTIIAGVRAGKKNREISASLGTTEQVVKNYLRRIYERFGLKNRYELILLCVDAEQGKVPDPCFDPYTVERIQFGDPRANEEVVDAKDYDKLLSIYSEALMEVNRLKLVVETVNG